ncbi:unnamed protein product [Brassica rapa]|uniref:Uncharacterized protein n=2 Tax=Brassica TaxID=3705 RepID=A0A8D9M4H1_BRACM|nr:unnamed protein product [Brassica napus]CAG7897998.1 unnamed protein product [Brassica rapa]
MDEFWRIVLQTKGSSCFENISLLFMYTFTLFFYLWLGDN